MMGKVTTHVLDTANGRPGAGMKIEFSVYEGAAWKRLKSVTTNQDGRTDEPLADGPLPPGQYRLKFHVGEYFKTREFLDVVPVRFNISDGGAHYHAHAS
jgi:5-hydroxyisourate hydrolase